MNNQQYIADTKLSVRMLVTSKENHHLYSNNTTIFIHYVEIFNRGRCARRVRRSLQTKDWTVARQLRDQILADYLPKSDRILSKSSETCVIHRYTATEAA